MEVVSKIQKSEKGQTLVEFALVIPIILLLFMGMLDFGRVNTADTQVTNATQEAAKEFAHLANTPEYEKWYAEDFDKPSKDKRINHELKELVVKNVNTVPAEHISVEAKRPANAEGVLGDRVSVSVTAKVPSLSNITFKNLEVKREVTLRIP